MTTLLNLFFNHLRTHTNLAEDEQVELANNFADIVDQWLLVQQKTYQNSVETAPDVIHAIREEIYIGE